MDTATAEYYRRYAHSLTASSEASRSAMLPHIERALLPGSSVLDVGAGSGRDVVAMVDGGFEAFGVEPSAHMRERALHLHPVLLGRIEQASLPGLGRPFSQRLPEGFDAVVCSAVLMHLDPEDLPRALESMVEQLRMPSSADAGATAPALIVSLPHRDPARLAAHRDADGRLFHNHDAGQLRDRLATLGLLMEQSVDSRAVLDATGTVWKTLIFRRLPRDMQW